MPAKWGCYPWASTFSKTFLFFCSSTIFFFKLQNDIKRQNFSNQFQGHPTLLQAPPRSLCPVGNAAPGAPQSLQPGQGQRGGGWGRGRERPRGCRVPPGCRWRGRCCERLQGRKEGPCGVGGECGETGTGVCVGGVQWEGGGGGRGGGGAGRGWRRCWAWQRAGTAAKLA